MKTFYNILNIIVGLPWLIFIFIQATIIFSCLNNKNCELTSYGLIYLSVFTTLFILFEILIFKMKKKSPENTQNEKNKLSWLKGGLIGFFGGVLLITLYSLYYTFYISPICVSSGICSSAGPIITQTPYLITIGILTLIGMIVGWSLGRK